MIRATLYDAQGHDQEIELPKDSLPHLEEQQLLWIDVAGREDGDIQRLAELLTLNPHSVADCISGNRQFSPINYGDYVHFDVATIDLREGGKASPPKLGRSERLDVAIGGGWLLTVHDGPLQFLEDFRDQDRGETLIGGLTAAALAASLLDWHLAVYLKALEDVEGLADRTDLRMLSARTVRDDLLNDLVQARRYVSRLRRSLAPQSAVFYGLSRPDIALIADTRAIDSYRDLERRFERVLDSIEHGRELVQSSFDLFATRTAETTNNLIRRLTFIGIMLGALGGVAGVFGMNFETPYAKSGLVGFWAVVATFIIFVVLATIVGRARRWF